MRLRNVKNAEEIVKNHPLVINEVNKSTFTNDNPIHIEIGMGKGDFIIEMSKKYPNINFIGIEKYESVMVRALEKIEESDNLRFLPLYAEGLLDRVHTKIDAIYLNFSDPWPKKRHEKRRLTHKSFLDIYEQLFSDKSSVSNETMHIYQKTDNKGLFAYSISSLSMNGYIIEEVSLDLANSDIPNIQSEYEKKFMALGETINYLHATKKI